MAPIFRRAGTCCASTPTARSRPSRRGESKAATPWPSRNDGIVAVQCGSNGFCADGEQDLKCRKGNQQGDERVLDRPAAPPALLQATEIVKAQTLTIYPVQQTIAPPPPALPLI